MHVLIYILLRKPYLWAKLGVFPKAHPILSPVLFGHCICCQCNQSESIWNINTIKMPKLTYFFKKYEFKLNIVFTIVYDHAVVSVSYIFRLRNSHTKQFFESINNFENNFWFYLFGYNERIYNYSLVRVKLWVLSVVSVWRLVGSISTISAMSFIWIWSFSE